MNKREYKGFLKLKYIMVKNVPISEDKEFGALISASVMKEIEHKVACSILAYRIPISGLEIEFFRSILGLSQRRFAELFKLSQVAILKWEREKKKRLSLLNEIAFRVVMAKHFNLNLETKYVIDGPEKYPKHLIVNFDLDVSELIDAALAA